MAPSGRPELSHRNAVWFVDEWKPVSEVFLYRGAKVKKVTISTHTHTHTSSHFEFILAKHRFFSVLSVWNWAQVRPHKGRLTSMLKNITHVTPISPSTTSAPLVTQAPCGILLMAEAVSCSSEEGVVLTHSCSRSCLGSLLTNTLPL